MISKLNYTFPVTEETIRNYAASIFKPITRGECVTTVWVPMAGRRMWNKFIIENIGLFEKELPYYQKYLLVYIEPLDLTEESLTGYIRLMAKSFIAVASENKSTKQRIRKEDVMFVDDPNATYSELLAKLKELLVNTTDKGVEVVFFIGEFDELTFANKIFYNNLKSLWSNLYPRLHYVFLMREYVVKDKKLEEWGDFNEAILQNIIYIPLLNDKDFEYVLGRMAEQLKLEVTKNQAELIKLYCGGQPYMIRVAMRILKNMDGEAVDLKKLENALADHYELRSVARGVLDVLSEKQVKLLGSIADGQTVKSLEGNELKSLESLGIVKSGPDGNYKVFGLLFLNAVKRSNGQPKNESTSDNDIRLDTGTGTIYLMGKPIEEKFTSQEYSVMVHLLQRKDKLCTRDDIGTVLWGKESYEKYSDWAIDQLVSKLRKKISSMGVRNRLITIRGKGYKLISAI